MQGVGFFVGERGLLLLGDVGRKKQLNCCAMLLYLVQEIGSFYRLILPYQALDFALRYDLTLHKIAEGSWRCYAVASGVVKLLCVGLWLR